ncbi:MAG: flagellar hook-associated protein FlgK [Bacillota bacterium]|nr:flagellar hook-associated protein FlgK [Bacillota bacterium]
MPGLFSTFNIATRGMEAQQKAIDVSSHNIANANTDGYSRQRVILETTNPYNASGMNSAAEAGQMGTGVQVESIQRVRDNFLDYQVRVETATQGKYNERDKYLSQIESIVNEPSDTGLSTLMGNFFNSWQQLSKQPESSNARTVVAQQSLTMCNELNHEYNELTSLKDDAHNAIKENVFTVNDLLSQIDKLNQQIISVEVSKQSPNDLMDKRDKLLDTLSSKFGIAVDKKSFGGITVGAAVEQDPTNPSSQPPLDALLIKSEDNENVRTLSYVSDIVKQPNGRYDITYYKKGDTTNSDNAVTVKGVNLTDSQYKDLEETRVIWADKDGYAIKGDGTKASIDFSQWKLFKPASGELKGDMSVQQDIDNFTDELNKLAKGLALSVNAIHSGKMNAEDDAMPFFVNSSNKADENGINAGNITVNVDIMNDPMNIKTRTHDDQFDHESDNNIDGETDGARALAIASLKNQLIKIQNVNSSGTDGINTRKDLFIASKGGNTFADNGLGIQSNSSGMTIGNFFRDVVDKLGTQEQEAKRMVSNQETLLNNFQQSRDSVSGVSLDEEMANLIQFQHAYQANAKIISTVDQLLDVVINGLKK